MCIGPIVMGLQTGREDLKTTRPFDWDALALGSVQLHRFSLMAEYRSIHTESARFQG